MSSSRAKGLMLRQVLAGNVQFGVSSNRNFRFRSRETIQLITGSPSPPLPFMVLSGVEARFLFAEKHRRTVQTFSTPQLRSFGRLDAVCIIVVWGGGRRCHVTLDVCGWLKVQIQNIQPKSGSEVNQLNCHRVVVNDIGKQRPLPLGFFS